MRVLRALAGTAVAVFAGWLAGIAFAVLWGSLGSVVYSHHIDFSDVVGVASALATYSPLFIAPIWLVVLIPLYLFVPAPSPLWHVPLCMVLGALAGVLIASAMFRPTIYWAFAGVIGAATCMVGASTRHVFRESNVRT